MVIRLSTPLIVALNFAINFFFTTGLTDDNVNGLNENFQTEIVNHVDTTVKQFLEAVSVNHPFTEANKVALRLYFEGTITGLVAIQEKPISGKNKSLVISVYGGNGAPALAVAKERAQTGENVTVLLLPCANGARGTNGIIRGNVHESYEKLESWLRKWNDANHKSITFVTVMDHDTTYTNFLDKIAFENAADELNDFLRLKDNVQAALSAAVGDRTDEGYTTAVSNLASLELKHYTADGFPTGVLKTSIANQMQEVLKSIGKNFDYCFGGHSVQGFHVTFGTSIFESIMKFVIKLKEAGVYLTSTDYQLGRTEKGLQTAIEPDMIIVIFLNGSIFAKDSTRQFQLKNVKIVQIDWNSVWKYLFPAVQQALLYTVAPDSVTVEAKSVSRFLDIKYRVLKSMAVHMADWVDVANSLE